MKAARTEEAELHRMGGRIVLMPECPKTASPVPWLTSIHAREGRGNYGDANYRGNCSGLLIEDLLRYFQPKSVLDPMAGSGTCADVCKVLGIKCNSADLTQGFDATDPAHFSEMSPVDFVWLHPPYWRMLPYTRDHRCLAEAPTLNEFLNRIRQVFRNCLSRLTADGVLAVLIGDGKEYGAYLGLPFRILQVAELEGLWLAAPEIVRFSHGSTSSKKVYNTSFIPRLHDVCLVLKRYDEIATPKLKVDFGAHLIHRGGFAWMYAIDERDTASSCTKRGSSVNVISNGQTAVRFAPAATRARVPEFSSPHGGISRIGARRCANRTSRLAFGLHERLRKQQMSHSAKGFAMSTTASTCTRKKLLPACKEA